jgi:uncharacterized membrane protein required for colicin V production
MMSLGGFNWIDLLILVVAVASLAIGYLQGMIKQVVWLAAMYVATILGAQYYSLVGGWIRALTFGEQTSRIVNVIAFFVIVVVVSFLLSWIASDLFPLKRAKVFPLLNQIGGSILGLASMIVLTSVVLWVILFSTGEPWPGYDSIRFQLMAGLHSSQLVPIFDALKEPLLKAILPFLPAGLPSIFNL